jgi:heme/copper-type cytochrome/quinol oxidase subunit 2
VNLADFGVRATSGNYRCVLLVVWLCAAITVPTTMIYSIMVFRQPDGDGAPTRMPSKLTQILWSLIPIGIFLGIAATAVKALFFTDDHCGL